MGHKWRSLEEEDRGKEVIPNEEGIVPENVTTQHHVLDNYIKVSFDYTRQCYCMYKQYCTL